MYLRGLQLFRDIVVTGTLAEAASRANMSNSAASRLLTQLEYQLGLTLFSRTRRALELTEHGILFYHQISNTLDGLTQIPNIAREVANRSNRTLSIVAAAPIANGLVVPPLARLDGEGISYDVNIHVESRFDIESKVGGGGYDIGLISLPVENEIVPLDVLPLLRTRLCVLTPADHPFASLDEVPVDRLAGEKFVTLTASQRWRLRLDEVMGKAGHRPDIAFQTGSSLVTMEMVRNGIGITLADIVFAPDVSQKTEVLRPIEGNTWITYAAVFAKGSRAALTEPFLNALGAHVEQQRAAHAQVADLMTLI
ncbi:LysR family transcriptional regulator [Marinovum sp. 2_MG-2023]|uniref:LysR family transcriptional regulator n=1 Tax=unclassified Marinovum TaxID=2647166 RepID=UPI0026E15D4B|nr:MULTISPECIES: LysR family transcriptional regulator [unclassified Marinovum]MDO6729002.1 LysR family transcriptional regulator [Marinovum sp. 2_MG-2023]MDO6779371.1 LysR family transcriptional regulator [Marinovum sp. 1_MG-2023]